MDIGMIWEMIWLGFIMPNLGEIVTFLVGSTGVYVLAKQKLKKIEALIIVLNEAMEDDKITNEEIKEILAKVEEIIPASMFSEFVTWLKGVLGMNRTIDV